MSCRGRDLCGKHELLQGRSYRRGKLYTDKKELPLYSEYKSREQCGVCHGSGCAYGQQSIGDSRKRIGRGMGRRDGCRFGNDNFTLKGLFYLRTIWDGK